MKKNANIFVGNKIITYLCTIKRMICQQYLIYLDTDSGFMAMTIRPFTFM